MTLAVSVLGWVSQATPVSSAEHPAVMMEQQLMGHILPYIEEIVPFIKSSEVVPDISDPTMREIGTGVGLGDRSM